MNKYHYRALTNSIIACTFIILGGQFWFAGDVATAYAFGGVAGLQILLSFLNERKADKES